MSFFGRGEEKKRLDSGSDCLFFFEIFMRKKGGRGEGWNEKKQQLTAEVNRSHGWKRVHDNRKGCPEQENPVGKMSKRSHPERPMRDVVAAFDQKTGYRDGIRNVKKDDTSRYHAKIFKKKKKREGVC
jgi:hypothetical protein